MTGKLEFVLRNGLMYAYVPFWSLVEKDYLKAFVLIDTGASVTAFGNSALKRLGFRLDGKKSSVNTASGAVEVREVTVPKILLGSIELNNITVHAHTYLDNFLFDGIIGMNVMGLFNFSVDFGDMEIVFKQSLNCAI